MQRIVVGVDGSETSRAALRWAAMMAGLLGAELEVIRAFRYPPALQEWTAMPSNYGFLPELPAQDVVEREVHDQLADTVTAELAADARAVVGVRRGHPAKVLLDAAAGADMLVIGRSGHGGLGDLIRLGSVARACTEHAPCPVVVIPAATAESGARPPV